MSHRLLADDPIDLDAVHSLVRSRYPEATHNLDTIEIGQGASLTSAGERELTLEPGDAEGMEDLIVAIARRIGGKAELEGGHEIEPSRFDVPALDVISPYALEEDDTLAVVKGLIREAVLDEGPHANGAAHQISAAVFPFADVIVRARPLFDGEVMTVAHVDWVKEGAVRYHVSLTQRPDREEGQGLDDAARRRMEREAYLACAAVAKQLHEKVGGFIVDGDGFLVNPDDIH
ncbi:hypothetical protein [Helcobacillus massiliensis]|uniref:Uncharacterized protein n=1 Tax=Helcobacillus massiliensis TaxID=521392 RepID=A0A839QU53_9MICO|nr:hypothetical protein [Helcobacillus massiliensis]MBB3023265.1 hypothetical protein [Helcobacillus massiliensis]